MAAQDSTQSGEILTPGNSPRVSAGPTRRSAQSLAASIRHDLELLSRLDRKVFLTVASDIRKKSREVEDTLLGEDHPHARFFDAHRNDPFLDEIKAMELSENVSD